MADKIKFWPIRGTYAQIMEQPYYDGKLYFAYDTNQIVLDVNGSKHIMGGGGASGSGITYANGTEEQIIKVSENVDDFNYRISMNALENPAVEPQKDALILNSDGRFFRVLSVDSGNKIINAILLAVSGSGGGGVVVEPDIKIVVDDNTLKTNDVLVYGKSHMVNVIATAETNRHVSLTFDFVGNNGFSESYTETAVSGEIFEFDLSVLPVNSNITMTITAKADNSNMPNGVKWIVSGIKVVEMGIKKLSAVNYIPVVRPEDLTDLSLEFIPIGDSSITEVLHVYVDNEELPELKKTINPSSYNSKAQVSIPRQSHGSHVVSLAVSTTLNHQDLYSDKIDFEIAWAEENNDTPIIWVGDYPEVVVNYENASIPFMVYNPEDVRDQRPSTVRLFKNGLQISEIQVSYSTSGWEYWDISAIYELGSNLFAIQQGISSKEFSVEITDVGSRDLGLIDQPLIINLSAAGRSVNELVSNRSKWENTGLRSTIKPTLTGFNWANNGWISPAPGTADYDNGSYLSIANGAKVKISPMGVFSLNNNFDYSFEIRFRVRNIQKYSTLVTNIPTYFYEELVEGEWILHNGKDEGLTIDVINNNENYRVAYDQYGSPWANEDKILQTVNTSNGVICSWLNGYNQGFVIGTQEAFFQSPKKLVSVRYKENEVINLAFVISRNEHLVYIYLNGIPAGATELPVDTANNPVPFQIENDIEFNSEYCDVDLYRFRLYQYGLSTPDVIHNYLSDIHSIKLYDQNQLTTPGKDNLLNYDLLCQYNENHPDEPTMPYAVWKIKTMDAEGRETLPYYKGDKRKADVTFVNPIGDMKLDKGLISPWFYYTHVPSTFAADTEINVQGTSSQGYPRRNYKIKHKKASSWIFTHGPLEGESVLKDHYFDANDNWIGAELEAQGENEDETTYKNRLKTYKKLSKNWHIDTESISTDQFTWKIDYMESSGSYNTGFANLMGNLEHPLYNKHPLSDLGITATDMRTTVYGFPVLTFHEYADPAQNISDKTAKYEYVGRYNINLDKSSNEYYGFKVKDAHPYLPGKTIAEASECWEMKDNQGSWCSMRFPSQAAREVGFDTRRGTTDIEQAKLEMTRHYEVRYNPDSDPIEAILGEQLNYNDTVAEEWRETVGDNRTAHNHYLRSKFYNLERLVYWLDSTDTGGADNGQIIWYEPVMDNDTKTVTIQQTPKEYVEYRTAKNYTGINGAVSVADGTSFLTKFYQNSIEYRKEKFRNEFEQHLDKHYCLIYFIMTELLLCFDSRGKNMMLASYGPHALGGEYIWYPIFYDIDTQLGLNNSGAYLWDYDEDVTLNGTFSTSTSVLWNNLYDVFYGDIVNMYIDLRGSNSSGANVGNLTYTNIVGAYECNSEVFNSLAMDGVRPIIAMGLDEYYKYFATTESSDIGYYDTEGVLKKEATASYAYCCQGDKKLTTELLLRNRLNYMDSWWLAGSYSDAAIVSSGIEARSAANNRAGTSDKYLDLTTEEINGNPAYDGFEHGDYPVPYFDSRAGFQIRPFLKQYVTYYVDGTAAEPKKFNDAIGEENGVWTNVLSSIEPLYKTAPNAAKDQIFKIPGADYISSLGDLSIAYLTRFQLNGGQRLLDLHIGSDVPGYKNNVLDPAQFNLHTEINDSMKKPLLRSVNLTNISSLATGINLSGSAKLEEFRGLDTPLTEVVFAAGAPLHTIHLPKTITSFAITEASDLTDLITSRPSVGTWSNGVFTYADPSTYRGLYIEDVTDADLSSMIISPGHAISRLEIHGGHLGYNSYKLLNTLVELKKDASEKNTLAINMTNVEWTPFELVAYGEFQDNNKTYYQLTEHSTFEVYSGTNLEDWKNLTLNEKIYTKNNWDTSVITSFNLLDTFRTDYTNATSLNKFTNTRGDIVKTYPALSGNMYIDNPASSPIDEFLLTDTYGAIWPDLIIRAANIQEAYIAKYIQVLDSGKEEEIDVIRYTRSSAAQVTLTNEIPSKQYHDFKGWSLTKGSTVADFATYDPVERVCTIISPQSFSSERTSIILYAVFENHPYTVNFYNVDGTTLIATTYSTYGEKAKVPAVLPIANESELALTRTYKFKGYSRTLITPTQATDYVIQQNVVNVANINVTRDLDFYAVYKEQSVYDETTDLEYFTFTQSSYNEDDSGYIPAGYKDSSYNISNGYIINIKDGYNLAGKITLPSYYNGLPVITLGNTFNKSNTSGGSKDITHIFWKESESEPCTLRTLSYSSNPSGHQMKLKYIELPEGLRVIGEQFFMSCQSIETITPIVPNPVEGSIIFPSTLITIADSAFNMAFPNNVLINLIRIPSSVVKLSYQAFANQYCSVGNLEIGTSSKGSDLCWVDQRNILDNTGSINRNIYNHNRNKTSNMTFYYKVQAQYDGFIQIEGFFANIETRNYVQVN